MRRVDIFTIVPISLFFGALLLGTQLSGAFSLVVASACAGFGCVLTCFVIYTNFVCKGDMGMWPLAAFVSAAMVSVLPALQSVARLAAADGNSMPWYGRDSVHIAMFYAPVVIAFVVKFFQRKTGQ